MNEIELLVQRAAAQGFMIRFICGSAFVAIAGGIGLLIGYLV